jgi:hypothetical protein
MLIIIKFDYYKRFAYCVAQITRKQFSMHYVWNIIAKLYTNPMNTEIEDQIVRVKRWIVKN